MQQPNDIQLPEYEVRSFEIPTQAGNFLLETGMAPLGKREHPIEAKIANLETQQLGFHALEYEGYINLFDEQEQLVGGLQLQRRWNIAKLYSLWVEPELRGLGLGQALMQSAEELSLSMGANAIMLETSTLHNYEFYLKLGFEIANEFTGFIPGASYFFMMKNLIPENTGMPA
ncbi:GNAT family N-acetyltransferase [Paraneptunicella aestuarii]|uniref:GNAT family N-acetyltransferase n=1 Tax=Paraneptunicella aestuarii TaxID=2831148 RepID=UPI001E4F33B6|nr:GNAT family N-acetyltransferase [Paraneptunicella aestuarii]UAA37099.1 GNAT family N-acetyltransferase [Paraneptunicella aestuarii]